MASLLGRCNNNISSKLQSCLYDTSLLMSISHGRIPCRLGSQVTINRTRVEDDFDSAKPMSAMPHHPLLPTIGSLWRLPLMLISGKPMCEHIQADFTKFGPIYRDKTGDMEYVFLSDPDAVEKVHRTDGKYPQRLLIESWAKWREEKGLDKGILIESNGENWRKMRSQLDKHMMRPKKVANYVESFNEVSSDFIQRLLKRRKADGTIEELDQELFNWSLETIGTVIYEKRFGNFNEVRDSDSDAYIQAVRDMFRTTGYVAFTPPAIAKLFFNKLYHLHYESWDIIFARGKIMIDAKMAEIESKIESGEEVTGFLSTLLVNQTMSMGEIYANISEMMAAAVDSTSNTVQWIIELLSRHPEAQERLYQEVMAVVAPGTNPTYQHIQDMQYLRAVIKEVLRIYPIANVVTKVLQQDAVLCGYAVPKGTNVLASTYTMGRDPNLFSNPLSFTPERWLRGRLARKKNLMLLHTYRLVMDHECALLMQSFRLEAIEPKMRVPSGNSILVPDKPVNVKYVDRKLSQ